MADVADAADVAQVAQAAHVARTAGVAATRGGTGFARWWSSTCSPSALSSAGGCRGPVTTQQISHVIRWDLISVLFSNAGISGLSIGTRGTPGKS